MKTQEFIKKVNEKSIKNGTIFDVLKNNKKIGQVGVIRGTIVYFEFVDNEIPVDLLIGDYIFNETDEE